MGIPVLKDGVEEISDSKRKAEIPSKQYEFMEEATRRPLLDYRRPTHLYCRGAKPNEQPELQESKWSWPTPHKSAQGDSSRDYTYAESYLHDILTARNGLQRLAIGQYS